MGSMLLLCLLFGSICGQILSNPKSVVLDASFNGIGSLTTRFLQDEPGAGHLERIFGVVATTENNGIIIGCGRSLYLNESISLSYAFCLSLLEDGSRNVAFGVNGAVYFLANGISRSEFRSAIQFEGHLYAVGIEFASGSQLKNTLLCKYDLVSGEEFYCNPQLPENDNKESTRVAIYNSSLAVLTQFGRPITRWRVELYHLETGKKNR